MVEIFKQLDSRTVSCCSLFDWLYVTEFEEHADIANVNFLTLFINDNRGYFYKSFVLK